MMKNTFYGKLFSFLRYLRLVLTFWLCRKQLGKEAMVNFKTYDFTGWATNNNITPIAEYLKN